MERVVHAKHDLISSTVEQVGSSVSVLAAAGPSHGALIIPCLAKGGSIFDDGGAGGCLGTRGRSQVSQVAIYYPMHVQHRLRSPGRQV